ncbi:MAG: DUF4267 domain-containing protein [Pseudomonadota bacterium]
MLISTISLAFLGVYFLTFPQEAMDYTQHTADQMPLVLGGRYLAMAAVIVALAVWGSSQLVAIVLLIFAGLGLIDAMIYRSVSLPTFGHWFAAFFALLGAGLVYFFPTTATTKSEVN